MQYDPTERRPTIEEVVDAIDTQNNDIDLPRLVLPEYSKQGFWSETTLYFQDCKKSLNTLNENKSESDKQWLLATLVDILRNVDETVLSKLAYNDISSTAWHQPPHLNNIVIETVNVNLRLNKDSIIDYGWMLDLAPDDHYNSMIIEILRLDTQYVVIFENSSID